VRLRAPRGTNANSPLVKTPFTTAAGSYSFPPLFASPHSHVSPSFCRYTIVALE